MAPEVEPLPEALPEVEPLPEVVPLSALSLDEPELDEDGEDGLDGAGVAGADGEVLLELDEPDPEVPELDGEDGEDDGEVVLPLPDVVRSEPLSQAAIRLAPSARDTATAKV